MLDGRRSQRWHSKLDGIAPDFARRNLLGGRIGLRYSLLLQQSDVLLLDLLGILDGQVVDLETDALDRLLDGLGEVRLTLALKRKRTKTV